MLETVLVTVPSIVIPRKGRVHAPMSRMRISKSEYDADQAEAKEKGHDPRYLLEKDQHAEGNTIEESTKENAQFIKERDTRRAAAAIASKAG